MILHCIMNTFTHKRLLNDLRGFCIWKIFMGTAFARIYKTSKFSKCTKRLRNKRFFWWFWTSLQWMKLCVFYFGFYVLIFFRKVICDFFSKTTIPCHCWKLFTKLNCLQKNCKTWKLELNCRNCRKILKKSIRNNEILF